MAFIKSRKHASGVYSSTPKSARGAAGVVTAVTLLTGLALALPAAATDVVAGPVTTDARTSEAKTLQGVRVTANGVRDYRVDQVASPKFTQPLQP